MRGVDVGARRFGSAKKLAVNCVLRPRRFSKLQLEGERYYSTDGIYRVVKYAEGS